MCDEEKQVFSDAVAASAKTREVELMRQFEPAPLAPDPDAQSLLQDETREDAPRPRLPAWQAHLVNNRDLFLGAAICMGDGTDLVKVWISLIILQQPFEIVWHRIEQVDPYGQAMRAASKHVSLPLHMPPRVFRFTDEFCLDDEAGRAHVTCLGRDSVFWASSK